MHAIKLLFPKVISRYRFVIITIPSGPGYLGVILTFPSSRAITLLSVGAALINRNLNVNSCLSQKLD